MGKGQRTEPGDIARLVRASQLGQRGAFNELVRLFQRRAMQVAVRMLGNVDEAAEAVQIGFVNAYLNIGKLKRPERFEPWLLRIVTNAAINQLREVKRRSRAAELVDCCRDTEDRRLAEQTIGSEDLKAAIERAMLKLAKKEAKAIALFGLEDMSQSEVAKAMGCSVGAVRWHVYRARQKLKVLLKEYL